MILSRQVLSHPSDLVTGKAKLGSPLFRQTPLVTASVEAAGVRRPSLNEVLDTHVCSEPYWHWLNKTLVWTRQGEVDTEGGQLADFF